MTQIILVSLSILMIMCCCFVIPALLILLLSKRYDNKIKEWKYSFEQNCQEYIQFRENISRYYNNIGNINRKIRSLKDMINDNLEKLKYLSKNSNLYNHIEADIHNTREIVTKYTLEEQKLQEEVRDYVKTHYDNIMSSLSNLENMNKNYYYLESLEYMKRLRNEYILTEDDTN